MRPRILIAEDEIMLAKDLARSLKSAGYEIAGRVSSGEEAIRMVDETKPNLVLMDIYLRGELDGVEAAERIRNRHDIPVVYLTGFAVEDLLERAKRTEPYGFLSKPVSLIELKTTIETTLHKHEADRRVRASENELRLVTDSVESLLAHVDSEKRYLWANRAYRELFELGSSSIKGRHVREVLGDETYSRILPCIERALSGEKVSFETSTSGASGELKHLCATYVPDIEPDGTVNGFIVQAVDITERKRSERILRARLTLSEYASNHTLDELLQKTLDVAESLTDSQIGFFHFLEADQETLVLQMWSTNTLATMCTAEGKGSHYPLEKAGVWVDCIHQRRPVIHNDYDSLPHRKGMPPGHPRVIRELVVPVFRGDSIVAILGVGNKQSQYVEADIEAVSQLAEMAWDIVERKKAEDALRRRDEFLTSIMEALTHPFYVVNAQDYTIQMSNSVSPAFGAREGLTCYAASHGRTVPCGGAGHPCPMEIVKSTGQPTMVEHIHADAEGRQRNVEVYAYPISDEEGKVKQIIEYCLDVTDRTEARQSLLESEKTLKTILSLSPSGIAYFRDGKLAWANRALMELLGYREDEQDHLLGMSSRMFYESDEEYARARKILLHNLNEGRPAEVQARFRKKDGSIFVGSMAVSAPISDHAGRETTVVISDITTRIAAEEERARLVTVIEQSAESIVVTDREGTIQYVNPTFEKLTGYTANEAVGENPRILNSGKHDKEFYRKMWETLTRGDIWRGHLVNKRKDGSLFEEEATISPVRDESGNIVSYMALKRDVTAQALLEKQLHQAQKMESIGTLSGGIAHDFNNLLQIILGYADMLITRKGEASPDLPSLKTIRKAAKDGGELVKGLLTFSRQVESKMRPTDLNLELKRIRTILRRTIPRMIEIKLLLADDLAPVNADSVQVEQVLLNLCVNAHHAMPKGGKLTIETENVALSEEFRKKHLDVGPGEYALLKITDTGHGMEREIAERIFEPFYTTKKAGEGTGLGLAIVYGIVRNHGGHVVCDSEPGRGTTFRIYFPTIVSDVEPSAADTAGEMPAFGTETILLVDDEESIRRLVGNSLTNSGYKVFTASNGTEALEIYRGRKYEIDLVVLDLIMPETGGEQCFEEILKIDPKATVLVASGHLLGRPISELLRRRAAGFIEKPFDSRELLLVVRGIMDQTGSQRSPVQASEGISRESDEPDGTDPTV